MKDFGIFIQMSSIYCPYSIYEKTKNDIVQHIFK